MEKVITKLRAGMMPPAGLPRPDEAAIGSLRSWIETEIDRSAIAQPNPGRTEAFHRMNRTEYQNAIRDLLDLNVDSSQFLPAEDSSNGFDNMAGTLRISQSLMARYLAAAKTVSRMALGKVAGVDTKVYKIVPDLQLAAHYGIPNVQGSDFRRVMLAEDNPRRGLLGQGSILTITSQPNRTSPVLRGKWFLKNVLRTPPPDPPPNVPALPDRKTQAKVRTVRERLAAHRQNPACASCHNMIDPVGFALENFDAIGKWRTVDESFNVLDVSGALPDGTSFNGANELRAALARHPERFVNTAAEKLLIYALGRGLEYYDMHAARTIVNDSTRDQYKFQSIILGVVNSLPFQMRSTAASGNPPVVAGIRRQ